MNSQLVKRLGWTFKVKWPCQWPIPQGKLSSVLEPQAHWLVEWREKRRKRRRKQRRKSGRWKVRRGVGRGMDRKNHPPKYPHPNSMCASSSSKCRKSQLQSFTLYPRDITTEASILFGTQFIFLIRNCPVAQPNIKLLRSNSPLLFIAPRPLLLPLKVAMTQPPIIGCPLPSLLEPLSELFLAHDFKYHPHNWCFLNMYL